MVRHYVGWWSHRELKFFFLCELPLILGVGGKLKKKKNSSRYLHEEFERDQSIGLGSTFGDVHTDVHTHTHTHTHIHAHTYIISKTHF